MALGNAKQRMKNMIPLPAWILNGSKPEAEQVATLRKMGSGNVEQKNVGFPISYSSLPAGYQNGRSNFRWHPSPTSGPWDRLPFWTRTACSPIWI